jgi:hypothetical protein
MTVCSQKHFVIPDEPAKRVRSGICSKGLQTTADSGFIADVAGDAPE